MSIPRIVAGIIAAAIVGFILWAVVDRFKLAAEVNQHETCIAAIAKPDQPVTACDPKIADKVTQARAADQCEIALAKPPTGDLFAIRAACSEQVKRVVADRDAAAANYADDEKQLAGAQLRLDQAVSRAEARNLSTTQRKAANDRTIQAAPRDPDGRVRCDAQCLRDLANPRP
jgi:type IV secretory pathway VirB10-like protein